ncbi:ATP-binding protein [Mucilaginibacter endophyticus]|uniref:ATP-binding protein n=1 Tax=Mucilaginibacter endophyticus TaxID=2675003 RepID=UPI000E0DDF17|nr:ATP-binding protein [Mucilaginibacter endophyticus]
MNTTIEFKSLLAYSADKKKYFFTEFGKGVNIVYGRNTSGKSTLFQCLLYTLGINDGNAYIKDLLSENVFFRLDIEMTTGGSATPCIFIRENETLIVKVGDHLTRKFSGISGNSSFEHIKLKDYVSHLFNFNLKLESKNEYKSAPLEAMLLPFYIAQSVGWVYLRKSFNSLDFYRNFKEDYLDYYLEIENAIERDEKKRLENQLKEKEDQISFISSAEKQDQTLQVTKILDEKFIETSKAYVETYATTQRKVIDNENEFILKCNELAFLNERLSVLRKVKQHRTHQKPEIGNCPLCFQNLQPTLQANYKFFQEENDTEKELKKCKDEIKDVQAKINSLRKHIDEDKEEIANKYRILNSYSESQINYDQWLNNKANVQLINNITLKVGALTLEKNDIIEKLGRFKTDEQVEELRKEKNNLFKSVFTGYLKEMNVKSLDERRYTELYEISSFPSQGVELHKTVMAYHFAFNKIIAQSQSIHRFPFMLDAILKEDTDENTEKLIINFISKNRPTDTQIIFSIAELKNTTNSAANYNLNFFGGKANLILIGDGIKERSLLRENDEFTPQVLIDDTQEKIDTSR